MEIQKVYKVFFSPTRSTAKVVEYLSKSWSQESETVDITGMDAENIGKRFTEKDLVIFGVPSYGGRVPGTALRRLQGLRGKSTPAVLVATFGNRSFDDTLLEMKYVLEASGFRITAAIAAVTEHSIMHEYGTGRPDDKDLEELREFADIIEEKLSECSVIPNADVPGEDPYCIYEGIPLRPKTGKDCTRCGNCVRECPVGAISGDDPTETDHRKCISCMRCVQVCPVHARRVSRLVLMMASRKMRAQCSGRKRNELFL